MQQDEEHPNRKVHHEGVDYETRAVANKSFSRNQPLDQNQVFGTLLESLSNTSASVTNLTEMINNMEATNSSLRVVISSLNKDLDVERNITNDVKTQLSIEVKQHAETKDMLARLKSELDGVKTERDKYKEKKNLISRIWRELRE